MFLSMADYGEKKTIQKIAGKDEQRHHLESLGVVEGTDVEVVTSLNGNLIVNVKGTRIAISKAIANKIIV